MKLIFCVMLARAVILSALFSAASAQKFDGERRTVQLAFVSVYNYMRECLLECKFMH